MKPLAPAVAPTELASELSARSPLVSFRGLEVYAVLGDDCPRVMREIGRLRELGFRHAGAGRGADVDLDALDVGVQAYTQLLAYDPERRELVAMLRFQYGKHAAEHGEQILRTSSLFEYSSEMRERVLPAGVELGRSVVNRGARRVRLGLFALWQGLSALVKGDRSIAYFFGNVTLYSTFERGALERLVSLCERWYEPPETMLMARRGLRYVANVAGADCDVTPVGPAARIAFLQRAMRERGERLPSMLQSYLSLGDDVWLGQTARDGDFGGALELGIVVPLLRLDDAVRARFGLERQA